MVRRILLKEPSVFVGKIMIKSIMIKRQSIFFGEMWEMWKIF